MFWLFSACCGTITNIKTGWRSAMKQQKKRWKAGALGLAAGAALAAGTAWAFQDRLEVTWYDAVLPEGLEGLDELKIAQISDVHSADPPM